MQAKQMIIEAEGRGTQTADWRRWIDREGDSSDEAPSPEDQIFRSARAYGPQEPSGASPSKTEVPRSCEYN
jgi:hypothetical protein